MTETKQRGRGRPRGSGGTPVEVNPDAGIDALIERRARERSKADEAEELWKQSVRAYYERRRRKIRAEWFAFFSTMAANHARIARDYERRAEELCYEEVS